MADLATEDFHRPPLTRMLDRSTKEDGADVEGISLRPVIFVSILGGFGNQLFIAAAASWARKRLNARPVLIDGTRDALPGPESRANQIAGIEQTIPVTPRPLGYWIERMSLSRRVQGSIGRYCLHRYDFPHRWKWSTAERLMGHSARVGTFPVWRGYFHYLEILNETKSEQSNWRRRLRQISAGLRPAVEAHGLDLAGDCVVHVRLGDYKTYGIPTLGAEYYERALAILRQQGFSGKIAYTSDEPAEAERIITQISPRPIRLCLHDPLEVMAVMSAARHKIIANSTLSFWAALLGDEAQRVVFPGEWLLAPMCRGQSWTEA